MLNINRQGTKCIIYVRVSKSRTEQTSLPSQERQCREYAARMGWEVVRVFVENGKSAYRKNTKRPAFDQAMSMIERNAADVFLVWKLDRFYRSGTEFQKAWNRIDESGGLFASVMEPMIDTTTAYGRQQLSGMAFQAEIESENRSQRTTAWHQERNANSTGAAVGGGHRPYGYERVGKSQLEINAKEARNIRMAADRFKSGDSMRSIHRDLAIPSAQKESVPMSDRGLRNVLINPTTYGLRMLGNGSLVKGDWDPILDPSDYGVIVSRLTDPVRRTAPTNRVSHLLGGILVCGRCVDSETVGDRKGRLFSRSNRNRYKCQCHNGIGEDKTDAFVIDRLFQVVTPDVWQGWKVKGHGYDESVRDEIQSRIDLIDMRLLQGKIDNDRYDRMNDELQRQLALSMSDEPLDLPDVDDLESAWPTLSVDDKRKVIRQAFESITVDPANGSYDPASRIAFRIR